jgi:U3 small nucleolar ribonucleoprotein protein IMP4
LPSELQRDALAIQKELVYDESHKLTTHVDDEYARAGEIDPKILITTSRDPSSRLTQFSKEMKLMFPNSQRMNRGNYVIADIVEACRKSDATDLIILHETRGQPDGLIVSHFPYGPTCFFSLHNVVLRHDIPDRGTVSEQFPHLIFHKFTSNLGDRVQNILKFLFPVPKESSKRVITFANDSDFISFRHHVYYKEDNQIELVEVGPRFEMRGFLF